MFQLTAKSCLLSNLKLHPMFVLFVCLSFSALFTFLVGWHTNAVSLPPDGHFDLASSDLNNVIFSLHQEPLTLIATSGLYYKRVMIVIDAPSVISK